MGGHKMAGETDVRQQLPASAVWHHQQAVEMSSKGAMLSTCGRTSDELSGKLAQDSGSCGNRLREAERNSVEQQRSQQLPRRRKEEEEEEEEEETSRFRIAEEEEEEKSEAT